MNPNYPMPGMSSPQRTSLHTTVNDTNLINVSSLSSMVDSNDVQKQRNKHIFHKSNTVASNYLMDKRYGTFTSYTQLLAKVPKGYVLVSNGDGTASFQSLKELMKSLE